tara:strand:- start:857 stop:1834 length:978 start_codon:yes stop_codon:yes gene_type:complete
MENSIPWVEKYRPQNLESISGQENLVNTLNLSLRNNMLPHLLFYGPPGTGKTSTILAISKSIYPTDRYERVLELNASHERGITVVRNKIKKFAKNAIKNNSKYPFKLVILDEADTMTYDAQTALRRCIEEYSKITRFCIICNYSSKIIEPIKSRCAIFKFNLIKNNVLIETLENICKKENITYNHNLLSKIAKYSRGDFRKSISSLQTISFFSSDLQQDMIDEIFCIPPKNLVNKIINIDNNTTYEEIISISKYVVNNGYSAKELIKYISNKILLSGLINQVQKYNICKKIGETEVSLLHGSDEFIQLVSLFSVIKENQNTLLNK